MRYVPVKKFTLRCHPSETGLQFLPDGTLVALLRRQGNAWIGTSKFPYEDWNWKNSGHYIGGPNFLILPDGCMIAGGRHAKGKPDESKGYSVGKTVLGRMTSSRYYPLLTLPSRGDNSYPGLIYKNGVLYVSYYSSLKNKTVIYFAKVRTMKVGYKNLVFIKSICRGTAHNLINKSNKTICKISLRILVFMKSIKSKLSIFHFKLLSMEKHT